MSTTDRLRSLMVLLLSFALAASLVAILVRRIPGDGLSVAAFDWPNATAFALTCAGAVLFVSARLIRRYRGGAFWVLLVFQGLSAGIVAGSLVDLRLLRPQRVAWLAAAPGASPIELDRAARELALRDGRPVLYYFRADWCQHCPDFERYRLQSPIVAEVLAGFIAVRIDLTDFERWRPFAEREFGVHGTPSLAFRDARGNLVSGLVVEGDDLSARGLKSLLLDVLHERALPPAGAERARHAH